MPKIIAVDAQLSPLTQGRGLKPLTLGWLDYVARSPLTQGRGLKLA